MAAGVESDGGTNGNPMLQFGGEQEAVTDPEPANGVERAQDCRHPAAVPITAGWGALQGKGIFFRMIPLFLLGKELFPITSVRTAVAFCEVIPLEVTKLVWLVCCDPARPTSRVMLWMGQ